MQVKTTHDSGAGSLGERDWRERGACRATDPELFFPEGLTPQALAQLARAQAVCATCPVIGACQEWALSTRERYGVWGGLSEQDRRAIWRSRAAVRRHVWHPSLPSPRRRGERVA